MQKSHRRGRKVLLISGIALLALVIVAGSLYYAWNPYRGTTAWADMKPSQPTDKVLTVQEAREDLAFLLERVKAHHISAAQGVPAATVQAQYQRELDSLKDEPTVVDVWQAGSRILRLLGDGHSVLSYMGGQDALRTEQAFVMIESGLLASGGEHNGKPVASLAGVPADELFDRFLAQYSYENMSRARYAFGIYLRSPQGLRWLGADPGDSLRVSWRTFVPEESDLPFSPVSDQSKQQQPVARYEIDTEHGVGILTLDACNNDESYRHTLQRFFTAVKEQQIPAIALDLRNNGGGNSTVISEFLRYIDTESYVDYGAVLRYGPLVLRFPPQRTDNRPMDGLAFSGDVYVLTGGRTFSSATQFAVVLRDNGLCRVIGQPPGNSPTMYGDTLDYQLPHSALALSVTFKQFLRPDAEHSADDALQPNIPTAVGPDSDGAMEALLQQLQH